MNQVSPYQFRPTQDARVAVLMKGIKELVMSAHIVPGSAADALALVDAAAEIGYDFPRFLLDNGEIFATNNPVTYSVTPINLNLQTRIIHEWVSKPFSEIYVGVVNRTTLTYWLYQPNTNTITLPVTEVPAVTPSFFGVKIENPQTFIERCRGHLGETLDKLEASSDFVAEVIRTLKLLNAPLNLEPPLKEGGLVLIQGKKD